MMSSLLSWTSTAKRRKEVRMWLKPQSWLTYGTLLVVQVCVMSVSLTSPARAQSPTASTMNCTPNTGNTLTTISCVSPSGGGDSAELAAGILFNRIFLDISSISGGSHTGALTVNLNNLSANVNTGSGTGHGITLDGTVSGSTVSGNLTVNHQSGSLQTGTRRTVSVRGSSKAALYVKSAASVTVTNAAPLSFAEKSGGGYNGGLRGIQAQAAANRTASVTNSAAIGFTAACTANCGTGHFGIYSLVPSGTGAHTVTNSGTISLHPNATTSTSSIAIYMEGGTPTVTNTGNITVDGNAVFLTGIGGAATVNFNGGTVTAGGDLVNAISSENITVTVRGGTATGKITLGNGADTVNVNGGTLVLANGASNFYGGTDTLTVNSGGTLVFGDDGTAGSKGVTISGLENFTVNSGGTIRFLLESSYSEDSSNVAFAGTIAMNGTGTTAPTIEIYLASGATRGAPVGPILLLGGDNSTQTISNDTLSAMASKVAIFQGGTQYTGTFTLSKTGGLKLTWSGTLTEVVDPSTMTCNWTAATATVACSGGTATDIEFTSGINLRRIFADISALSSGSRTGNLTVNLNTLAANVNTATASTGHGITMDGTATGSTVSGNLTVNHQTTTASNAKKTVFVRGERKAALFVKSAASVTVSNAANLVLAEKSGGGYNAGLRGIQAEAAANGTVSVSNTGNISFAATCTTNCSSVHVGIFSQVASGTGANTVTNSGTITMRPNATTNTSSIGFYLSNGTQSFTNTGTINVDSYAVWFNNPTGASVANFNGGTVTADTLFNANGSQAVTVNFAGGTATGKITLGGGAGTVNVNNGGTLVIGNGTSDFGGGTDTITVNSGGSLHLGDATSGSDGVTLTALETFTVSAGATLRLYLDSTFSGTSAADANDFVFASGDLSISSTSNLEIYLPSGYTIGDRTAFTLIDVNGSNNTLDGLGSNSLLTALASRVKIYQGTALYTGTITLTKATNERLQIAWTDLAVSLTLSCRLASNVLTCTGGQAAQLGDGITKDEIFNLANITSNVTGGLTINLQMFNSDVNDASRAANVRRHAIAIDGTSGTTIGGLITLNVMRNGNSGRALKVRGNSTAGQTEYGIFVSSRDGVTIFNGAAIDMTPGNSSNYQVAGIYTASSGSSNTARIDITNTGAITCTACYGGEGAKGFVIVSGGYSTRTEDDGGYFKTDRIVNRGNITFTSATGNTAGFRIVDASLTGGNNSNDFSFINTGRISAAQAGSTLLYLKSGVATTKASIGLEAGSHIDAPNLKLFDSDWGNNTLKYKGSLGVYAASGSYTHALLGGSDFNDTTTIERGALFTVATGTSDMRGGTDTITVNRGGHLGFVSGTVINGLEKLDAQGGSVLNFSVGNNYTAVDVSGNVILGSLTGNTSGITRVTSLPSTQNFDDIAVRLPQTIVPYIRIHVPSGFAIGAQQAFTLFAYDSISYATNALAAMQSVIQLQQRQSDGSLHVYKGKFFLYDETDSDGNKTNKIQIAWRDLTRIAAFACSRSGTGSVTVDCLGGNDLTSITGATIFSRAGITGSVTNLTVNLDGLTVPFRDASASAAFYLDGQASSSQVSGNITVNNQHNTAHTARKVFSVHNSGSYGIYVSSAAGATVDNRSSVLFGYRQETDRHNNNLTAIYVKSRGAGVSDVRNASESRIGFVANGSCLKDASKCGNSHIGIHVDHTNATGNVMVTNYGTIDMGARNISGSTYDAIRVDVGGNPAAITITNQGLVSQGGGGGALPATISGSLATFNAIAIRGTSGSNGPATVNINGASSVVGRDVLNVSSTYGGNVTLNVRGFQRTFTRITGVDQNGNDVTTSVTRTYEGRAAGNVVFTLGNDTINVYNHGTLNINQGFWNFGAGTDTVNIEAGGRLALGKVNRREISNGFVYDNEKAPNPEALEAFNLKANGILRIVLNGNFDSFNLGSGSTATITGTGSNAPVIELMLPQTYNFGVRSAFSLFLAGTLTVSGDTLTGMGTKVKFLDHLGNPLFGSSATFTQSGQALQVAWNFVTTDDIVASALTCAASSGLTATSSGGTLTCGGGSTTDGEYTGEMDLRRIFKDITALAAAGQKTNGLTVQFGAAGSQLQDFNRSIRSSGSGIRVDTSTSGSRVTGMLTVNNQATTIASANRGTVYVRGSAFAVGSTAGMRVKHDDAVTVNNHGDIVFAQLYGRVGRRNVYSWKSKVSGIYVQATGTGNVVVENTARIGFASAANSSLGVAACSSACGTSRAGINVDSTGTAPSRSVTITNRGTIDMGSATSSTTADQTASYAIGVSSFAQFEGSLAHNVTINNYGRIDVGGVKNYVFARRGAASQNSTLTINLESGSDINARNGLFLFTGYQYTNDDHRYAGKVIVNAKSGSDTDVVMSGSSRGTNRGQMTFTIADGAKFNFAAGSSATTHSFGSHNDNTFTAESGSEVSFGRAGGSKNVTLSGLKTFTAKSGSTLKFYLSSSFSLSGTPDEDVNGGTTSLVLEGDSNGSTIIEIHLPTGLTLGARTAFTLFSASATTSTSSILTAIGGNVKLYQGGSLVSGATVTTSVSSGNLRVAWTGTLTVDIVASTMNCTPNSGNTLTTISCVSPSGGGDSAELAAGIRFDRIFKDISSLSGGSHSGALTVNINNLSANVNTGTGTGHGITLDGTATNSQVSGNLTVNHQTTTATNAKKTVFVRGGSKAALYVKSSAGVTVTNAAPLSFATKSGGGYNSVLTGIWADAASGTATVTNSGTLGFTASCSANCGTTHNAIYSKVTSGTGANTVTNSGTINMRPNASFTTNSIAIELEGGTPTVTNTGNITVDGNAVLFNNIDAAGRINFNGGTVTAANNLVAVNATVLAVTVNVNGGTATGKLSFSDGADRMNINNGGTLVIGNGTSAFGGSSDIMTVNSGGNLHIGDASNGSDDVAITALESFVVKSGSSLRLYMDSNSGIGAVSMSNTALTIESGATIDIYVPAGYVVTGDLSATTLISLSSIVGSTNVNALRTTLAGVDVRFFRGTETDAYRGNITLSESSGNLQIAWTGGLQQRATATTLTCGLASNVLTCTGGNTSELNAGINMNRIFQSTASGLSSLNDGTHTGNLTVNLNNLRGNVNTSGTGHGVTIDGTATGSVVTGNLTVNHQTTGTRRTVFVRGATKAALYVKSGASVAVDNRAALSFATKSGGGFNTGLRGIWAIAAANGTSTVTNSGTISFAASCSSDCGASRSGIYSNIASGTGANTVTNSGTITMRPNATLHTNGVAIGVDGGTPTVTNTGNITVDYIAVFATNFTGAATVNFNSGTVTSDNILVFSSSSNNALTVNVNGGTAQGTLSLGNGNNAVNVNNGGTLVLDDATSTSTIGFAGGTDSITVNSGGALHIGDAANGSDSVTFTGLETFTVKAGATLRLYMDGSFTAAAINAAVTIENAPTIEIYLADNYTLAAKSATTLIDTGTLTISSAALTGLASRVTFVRGGTTYRGAVTFTTSNNNLQIGWTGSLAEFVDPTTLTCIATLPTLTCTGGSANSNEFTNGIRMDRIFAAITALESGTRTGNLTVNLNNLAASVNTTGTDHGISMDGTAAGSVVTGNLTVNHQTNSVTKRTVFVRGGNKAALFVKSAASVTVTNAANLVFAQSGNTYNSLIGITAQSAGTGNVSVTNNSGARIGFASDCSSNCGSAHRGIAVIHDGSGTVSVSNAGTINLLGSGGGDAGILVAAGTATGAVTITNTGTINSSSGNAIRLSGGASNDTATINLSGTVTAGDQLVSSIFAGAVTININGGTATGGINLAGGADRVNINGGTTEATLTLGGGNDVVTVSGGTLKLTGASNFGGGTDSITVNRGATFTLAGATPSSQAGTPLQNAATIAGLESFVIKSGATTQVTATGSVSNGAFTGAGVAIGNSDNSTALTVEDGASITVNLGTTASELSSITLASGVFTNTNITIANSNGTTQSGASSQTIAKRILQSTRFVITNAAGRMRSYRGQTDANSLNASNNIVFNNLASLNFLQLATDNNANARQRAIAQALQQALDNNATSDLLNNLYDAMENEDANAFDRVAAPIYASMIQSNWFADQALADQVLNQSCAESNYLGERRYRSYSRAMHQGKLVCGRTAIWGSLLRKTDSGGVVGFDEYSPLNFASFIDLSVTNQVHMSVGGGYSLLVHENNRGGESNGHRFSFATSAHFAENGLLQTEGFKASGAMTLAVTTHDMERSVLGADVKSDSLFVNYGFHANVAYRAFVNPDVYIEPSVAISATQIFMQEINESGIGTATAANLFNLNVNDEHFNFASARAGLVFGGDHLYPDEVTLQPLFKIGMTYILSGSDELDITSQLAGGGGLGNITYKGDMDDVYVDFSVGVQLFANEQFFGSLDYDGMVGVEGDTGRHSATFKLSF